MGSDLRRQAEAVVKRAERLGLRARRNGAHTKLYDGRRLVATLSSTPSDIRSVRNDIATLRRAGYDVRQSPTKRKGSVGDRQVDALRHRLVRVLDAGITVAELSRHAMAVAESRRIWGFKNERSAQVAIARLRDGRGGLTKRAHDLVAATLRDIEQPGRGEPAPEPEAEPVVEEQLPLRRSEPLEDWMLFFDSLERTMRLARAAVRRTLEGR
jgi:hypothetical protein